MYRRKRSAWARRCQPNSHEVEAAERHERAEPQEDHDLDAVSLDRSVDGAQDAVSLGAILSLLVQDVPGASAHSRSATNIYVFSRDAG